MYRSIEKDKDAEINEMHVKKKLKRLLAPNNIYDKDGNETDMCNWFFGSWYNPSSSHNAPFDGKLPLSGEQLFQKFGNTPGTAIGPSPRPILALFASLLPTFF